MTSQGSQVAKLPKKGQTLITSEGNRKKCRNLVFRLRRDPRV